MKQTLNRFERGITDDYIDAPEGYAQKMDNLLLNEQGKPVQRWALTPLNTTTPQLPSGNQAVDSIYHFQGYTFAKSGKKLYFKQDSGTSWFTMGLSGGVSGTDIFKNSAVGCGCSWSEWAGHLFITPHPNAGAASPVMMVWQDDPTTVASGDCWVASQAGLPSAKQAGFDPDSYIGTASGATTGMFTFITAVLFRYVYPVYDTNNGYVMHMHLGAPGYTQIRVPRINSGDYPTPDDISWTNSGNNQYPDSSMDQMGFRTKENGTALLYSHSASQGTAMQYKRTDAVIGAPAVALDYVIYPSDLYTNGGVKPNGPVPHCYYSLVLDGYGFYVGYVEADTGTQYLDRVLQSNPANPRGCYYGNYASYPGVPCGVSYVGSFPIILTSLGAVRVEGRFDAFGNGGMICKPIQGAQPAIPNAAIVKSDRGVYYTSATGWVFTDGFKAYPVSDHLITTFAALANKTNIVGVYDRKYQRVYFGVESADLSPSVSGNNNSLFVLDEKKSAGGAGVFTTCSGETRLQPTSLHYDRTNSKLLVGDKRGYVFYADYTKYYDVTADTAQSDWTLWGTAGIVWDYISSALSYGTTEEEKFFVKLYGVFKKVGGALSAQLYMRKDLETTDNEMAVVRDRSVTGIHKWERWFPAGKLWAIWHQFRIKKGTLILFRSDDYALATCNNTANTVLLASGTWPEDGGLSLVGHSIYFADDGYVTGFPITVDSGDTLTVTDTGNVLPNTSGREWIIKGVPKGEGVEFQSFSVEISSQGDTDQGYGVAEDGSNT